MEHSLVFGDAKWVEAQDVSCFPVIRTSFILPDAPVKKATLHILGLGTYIFFVNGVSVTDDLFQPINSNYENVRRQPIDEVMGVRAYYNVYDLTSALRAGEKNTIATMLGMGWYDNTKNQEAYGNRKLCLSLTVETEKETLHFGTSEADTYAPSYVKAGCLLTHEEQDLTDWDPAVLTTEYDDAALPHVVLARPLDTDYQTTDCPRDAVISTLTPAVVKKTENATVYDVFKNTVGMLVLRPTAECGEIKITFGEDVDENNDPIPLEVGPQHFYAKFDGKTKEIRNLFSWFGFRYCRVEGPAELVEFLVTRARVNRNSSFTSCNETLNWIYDTYLHTQTCNLHHGQPSDCPHIERRGYTGDGQLTAKSAMHCLDMHAFYRKWMEDISDCQDRISGHIQYTAPYVPSGGGPGGWGCAIVMVPYAMWKHYGDDEKLAKYYPQMLHWFDYMEAHSDNLLVTSDQKGAWCLGDWCTPGPVELPAPFVNNYFYVKSLEKAIIIAEHLGKTEDIPSFQKKIEERRYMTEKAYFNTWDSNFFGARQGGNAFALDMGIGNERTKRNFIEHYENLGHYDTGIFGTEVVTRLLFEYGRADLALRLMTAEELGYGKWRKDGRTTFWEYWGEESRSHNHPMFGAAVTFLWEYLLGIRQEETSYGFDRVKIAPAYLEELPDIAGHITTPHGVLGTAIRNHTLTLTLPEGVQAEVTAPDGSVHTVSAAGTYTF